MFGKYSFQSLNRAACGDDLKTPSRGGHELDTIAGDDTEFVSLLQDSDSTLGCNDGGRQIASPSRLLPIASIAAQ